MKYWRWLWTKYRIISIFSLVLLMLSLLINIHLFFNKNYPPVAYHSYYEAIRPKYDVTSKVRIESYFEDGVYNIYTSIYEITPEKKVEEIDILSKGHVARFNRSTYFYKELEQSILQREQAKFIDKEALPITHSMFESKYKLPNKNKTIVIDSKKNYLTVISFRNYGQILSFYRY